MNVLIHRDIDAFDDDSRFFFQQFLDFSRGLLALLLALSFQLIVPPGINLKVFNIVDFPSRGFGEYQMNRRLELIAVFFNPNNNNSFVSIDPAIMNFASQIRIG